MTTLGGPGIGLSLRGKASNVLSIAPGNTYVPPAGTYFVQLGVYTSLQYLDPVTGIWRDQLSPGTESQFSTDGTNFRMANLTGCPVGAVITQTTGCAGTTGIGVTATAMMITVSTGSSTWCPIVGGAISTTCLTGVTGSTLGAGYLYPPLAIISPPPPGGLQATAHVTGIPTTGALLAAQLIIDNQGAGYPLLSTGVANATLTLVNDPRDTVGSGATVRLALTGTGLLVALYPLNQGVPNTVVPTLTLPGSGAATPVMNFTVTTFATGWTGSVWSTGAQMELVTVNHLLPAATINPLFVNPIHERAITFPRPARIAMAAAGSTITTSGAVIEDAGYGIQVVPALTPIALPIGITGFMTGIVPGVASVGGTLDYSWLQPI